MEELFTFFKVLSTLRRKKNLKTQKGQTVIVKWWDRPGDGLQNEWKDQIVHAMKILLELQNSTKLGWVLGAPKGLATPSTLVSPVVLSSIQCRVYSQSILVSTGIGTDL